MLSVASLRTLRYIVASQQFYSAGPVEPVGEVNEVLAARPVSRRRSNQALESGSTAAPTDRLRPRFVAATLNRQPILLKDNAYKRDRIREASTNSGEEFLNFRWVLQIHAQSHQTAMMAFAAWLSADTVSPRAMESHDLR
jgi:hypothetical protein